MFRSLYYSKAERLNLSKLVFIRILHIPGLFLTADTGRFSDDIPKEIVSPSSILELDHAKVAPFRSELA